MTDYCAGCGKPLKPAPLGGRYRCCADAYWSEAVPEIRDGIDHQRITGLRAREQSERYNFDYGTPLYGHRIDHARLYFYRPALGWV